MFAPDFPEQIAGGGTSMLFKENTM
ncbi:uncharacterized protein FFC1_15904 [Fusarium fujikuroi]|nr:uncharacterized protein FFC1_15904 [Fusarium fujikuroi]SCV56248.1 uncharacterized protein FFB14_14528 [Fusarium fujikuroi]